MKKAYVKPFVEIERYELNESIASNCKYVVSNGPAMGNHQQCDDYFDPFATDAAVASYSLYNVHFYEDTNCDCEYSATEGYWTS